MQPTPYTKVNRNRAHNVDTDRLLARRPVVRGLLANFDGTRADFANRAAELVAIERVLVARGALALDQCYCSPASVLAPAFHNLARTFG